MTDRSFLLFWLIFCASALFTGTNAILEQGRGEPIDLEDVDPLPPFYPPPPPPPPAPTPPAGPKIVTLGDSYMSGTGIHRDGDDYDVEYGGTVWRNGIRYKLTARGDNECWRETDTTPGPRLAAAQGIPSVFLACKGAELSHVKTQFRYLNAVYANDKQIGWAGSTILLTAAGNDIRFEEGEDWPELLKRCIKYRVFVGDCTNKSWSDVQTGIFQIIQAGLTLFYKDIVDDASEARIRVMGYPKLMQRDPGCGSVTGINKDEADYMDSLAVQLNAAVQNAVLAAKAYKPSVDIEFVNVYNYLTVGACGDGPNNRHVHDKRLNGVLRSDSSFHPSQLGYDEYYNALVDSL